MVMVWDRLVFWKQRSPSLRGLLSLNGGKFAALYNESIFISTQNINIFTNWAKARVALYSEISLVITWELALRITMFDWLTISKLNPKFWRAQLCKVYPLKFSSFLKIFHQYDVKSAVFNWWYLELITLNLEYVAI